jgi:hypothetical protein
MCSTTRSLAALAATLGLVALASAPAAAGAKKYFVTVDSFAGDAVLDACGKGFHMATLWEILDVTQLKYDAARGLVLGDSGSGPPAELVGWVRTGTVAFAGNNVGFANCNAWTSNQIMDYGSAVELDAHWELPAVTTSPWSHIALTCETTLPVWCKQN